MKQRRVIMAKKKSNDDITKRIRQNLRLKTKRPTVETPKNVYSRKDKHKRRLQEDSSFFIYTHQKSIFSLVTN